MQELELLQRWYLSQCDGDWEHIFGISLATLDNPGWSLDIQLAETPLENQRFEPLQIDRSDTDWVYCKVADNVYEARGGPLNLTESIRIFLDWANAAPTP